MKTRILLWFAGCAVWPVMTAGAVEVKASSSVEKQEPARAVDGAVMDEFAWLSASAEVGKPEKGKGAEPREPEGVANAHWLELDFGQPRKVGEVHLYSGMRSTRGVVIKSGEFQIKEGGEWRRVAGFSGNESGELRIILAGPVETSSLRLWTPQAGQVAVREITVHEKFAPLREGLTYQKYPRYHVSVSQLGYNADAPKRFTVPNAEAEGVTFLVRKAEGGEPLFKGVVKGGVGDFSEWKAEGLSGDFVIQVEGKALQSGKSWPFAVKPELIQKSLLQPAVDFMIDARSGVGTHASAYGGTAWRDSSYYTHDLASLVTLLLAFPEEIAKQPRQIDWAADKAKVMTPDFTMTKERNDTGALEAMRSYYERFEPPAADAPDVVKLIHWGLGMTIVKPRVDDPSGDPLGERVHSQWVEQVAYVLALKPRLEKWIPASVFEEARKFVDEQWKACGLLDIPPTWDPAGYRAADDPDVVALKSWTLHPYKGRHAPGHSILPNLLMHEMSRRDDATPSPDYFKAALAQAEYVIAKLDWNDPRTTKGHRMSEHKTVTGLVWLLQNYPQQAPARLKGKLEAWAEVAIARSANPWDFRRYDLGDHWAIPFMNEPGSLAGFPACALSVSWVIDDAAKKQRLHEISYGALDCLFGRNPINRASPFHPEKGWGGMLEKGWPAGFPDDKTARLEMCRASLSSSPGSEMFPFNPYGKLRGLEGWTAFNTALNVGLSYLEMDKGRVAKLPEDCLRK